MQSTDVATFTFLLKTFSYSSLGWSLFLCRDLGHILCSRAITHQESYSMAGKRHRMSSIRDMEKGKDQLDLSGLS